MWSTDLNLCSSPPTGGERVEVRAHVRQHHAQTAVGRRGGCCRVSNFSRQQRRPVSSFSFNAFAASPHNAALPPVVVLLLAFLLLRDDIFQWSTLCVFGPVLDARGARSPR